MSVYCSGNCGENCDAIVLSGRTSARYSPAPSSLKFVCKFAPTTRRSFADANTTRNPFAGKFTFGKIHSLGVPGSSVSAQPFRFTVLELVLKISIQSDESPTSSRNVLLLLAMNSEIITCAGSFIETQTSRIQTDQKGRINLSFMNDS